MTPATESNHVVEKRSLIGLLLVLMAAFVYMMRPFLVPVVISMIIVVVLYPSYQGLTARLGNRPKTSAFLATLLVFAVFIVPSALVTSLVVNQTSMLIGSLDFKTTFQDLFANNYYNTYVVPYVTDFEARFGTKIDIFGWLTNVAREGARYVYNFSPQVLIGTATFIFDFFIMIVAIYFLFLEGPKLVRVLFDISPLRQSHEEKLFNQIHNTIYATVFGYWVTALVQAVLAAAGFAISGLSTYVVLGTLTFFMSMVPIIGASGVWIPVSAWFFIKGEIGWGIFHLVYGAVLISGIDNIIKPMIIQGRTHIHPLMIFFSLIGGIALFGPLGILFGPVITALLFATIKIYREELA